MSREWPRLEFLPWYRRPKRVAVVVGLCIVALGVGVWWMITHGWPEHQIRQDSATLRSVELPQGFDEAPWACASGTLLCAWTDLEPEAAAQQISAELADAGISLPDASCGVGTRAPLRGLSDDQHATAPGVCAASIPRHGVDLGLVAFNQVPIGEIGAAPVDYPRTLVTVGWIFDTFGRTVPGTTWIEHLEIVIPDEEIDTLPVSLVDATCLDGCLARTYAVSRGPDVDDQFRAVLDELLGQGVRVDEVRCVEAGMCTAFAFSARPAHEDQSFLYILETRESPVSVELSIRATP